MPLQLRQVLWRQAWCLGMHTKRFCPLDALPIMPRRFRAGIYRQGAKLPWCAPVVLGTPPERRRVLHCLRQSVAEHLPPAVPRVRHLGTNKQKSRHRGETARLSDSTNAVVELPNGVYVRDRRRLSVLPAARSPAAAARPHCDAAAAASGCRAVACRLPPPSGPAAASASASPPSAHSSDCGSYAELSKEAAGQA